MLQSLRDKKNSALIVILFAVIVIVFVFMFGLPSMDSVGGTKGHVEVVKVGGHKVTSELLNSMVAIHFDDNVRSSPQYPALARQLSEGIGVIFLLADEARKAGLRVTDEDLHDYITNWESGNPDVIRLGFLRQNKFEKRNYTDALQRFAFSARNYEDYKRNELLARRYMTLLSSSITVSDELLWAQFSESHRTASLEWIRLTPDSVRATFKPLKNEEIQTFIQSNGESIQTHYDEHVSEYTTPPKAKLHQIVIQKNLDKLTNPGAKTVKTYQAGERFAIARAKAMEAGADFVQVYSDYDESEDKTSQGITPLLAVEIMADELQAALKDKKAGDIVFAELSDRYVIAKIVEQTDKVVKPLAEVKEGIAVTMLDERRIQSRTDEIVANILAQAGTEGLSSALASSMYANILAEPLMVPAETVSENAEVPAEAGNAEAGNAEAVVAPEPALVAVPSELPIIPESERVKVTERQDVATHSGFFMGIGVSDDLARDIRAASENTVLPRAYKIGPDTFIVKVVSQKAASREAFEQSLPELREQAIRATSLVLVGDPDEVLSLTGKYGLWITQKLKTAQTNGTFVVTEKYFQNLAKKYVERQNME